jgi:hypothetical protein
MTIQSAISNRQIRYTTRLRLALRLLLSGFPHELLLAYRAHKIVAESHVDPWYQCVPSQRAYAVYAIRHILQRLPHDAKIIEGGTGLGQILFVLSAKGYYNLVGLDYNSSVYQAALKLRDSMGGQYTLVNADCLSPSSFTGLQGSQCYLALNWTYQHAQGVPKSVEIAANILSAGGLFILDLIPSDCPLTHHTSDLSLPIELRRESEYRYRWSKNDFIRIIADAGFEVLEEAFFEPRWVYVCRRTEHQ